MAHRTRHEARIESARSYKSRVKKPKLSLWIFESRHKYRMTNAMIIIVHTLRRRTERQTTIRPSTGWLRRARQTGGRPSSSTPPATSSSSSATTFPAACTRPRTMCTCYPMVDRWARTLIGHGLYASIWARQCVLGFPSTFWCQRRN